jgi:hypothetical protein
MASPASSASVDLPRTPDESSDHLSSIMKGARLHLDKKQPPNEELSRSAKSEERDDDHDDLSLHHDATAARLLHHQDNKENAIQMLHRQHTGEDVSDNDNDHLFLKGDEDDHEVLQKTTSRESTGQKSTAESVTRGKMTDEQVIQAIEKELGPWKCDVADLQEKEVVIAQEVCILMRRVMIRGYAVLTNHRLCFIAFLPVNNTSDSTNDQHDRGIIRASPAILHRPGLTKRRRKAWFVLTQDSITAYPTSDELYEPLGGVRLNDIRDVAPAHIHGKHAVAFKAKGNTVLLEFETEEAASIWIKDIDVARWRLSNEIDKVRIAIPLVRIAAMRMQDALEVCKMIYLDVITDDLYSSSGHTSHEHVHLHRKENISSSKSSLTKVVFGFHLESSTTIHELESAKERAHKWRAGQAKANLWSLPPAILEIDGAKVDPDEALEATDKDGSMQMRIIDEFSLDCKPEELQCKSKYTETILEDSF